jgi:hypothetical protein
MYDIQRATALSIPKVLGKVKHADHERTMELARMYRAFATGEDLKYMLRRFDRRESEADFEQACRIAQQITKPIVSALMAPAKKVPAVRPVIDRVDYGKETAEAVDLRDMLSEWYGGKSVTEYMGTLLDKSDIDPNAFVILTFDPFDYWRDKPMVYPVHVGCENVWGFEYINGELAYLFLAFQIEYEVKPGYVDGSGKEVPAEKANGMRYVMYTADHHIVYEQIHKSKAPAGARKVLYDQNGVPVTISGDTGVQFSMGNEDPMYFLRNEADEVFGVRFYEQKSGRVPAFRLGCRPDALTDGRTCVNRWDEAEPYLKKSLKQVRELDLTTALHAFPQKLQYVSGCTAKGCNGGHMPSGEACETCKGDGFTTISTAQDHITLRLPKKPDDPRFELSKLVHYVPLPVELIQQMRDIVKETRSDCFKAVYGSDLYGQNNVGKTYEEVIAMNQAMYDSLKPLADWWCETYMTITHVYANYHDFGQNLVVILKLPQGLGFETSATAFQAIKAARDAGASVTITANLDASAINILFRDDTDALKKVKVQARFDPYPGMSPDTVVSLISGGKASDRSAMMWTERATIFRKAESQFTGDVTFYDVSETKQEEVINAIVDAMIAEKEAKAALAMPRFAAQTGFEDTPEDVQQDTESDPQMQPAA